VNRVFAMRGFIGRASSFAERYSSAAGPAFVDFTTPQTRMAGPVGCSAWFGATTYTHESISW
jgi:hypothetical protein